MKCSKLIMIFGICYCFSITILCYERMIWETVSTECRREERAIDTGLRASISVLANSVYEDNPELMARETYLFARCAYLGITDEEQVEGERGQIQEFTVYVNEKAVTDKKEFQKVKAGDRLTVYIRMCPRVISAPGRRYVMEKTGTESVILD